MGLDISFRFRKMDAEPIGEDYGRPVYKESDIYQCSTSFCGRSAFACVREWVGDDRYGTYIPLEGENFDTFVKAISNAFESDEVEFNETDIFAALDEQEINSFSLLNLYTFALKGKIVSEKMGWYLEIECDW